MVTVIKIRNNKSLSLNKLRRYALQNKLLLSRYKLDMVTEFNMDDIYRT